MLSLICVPWLCWKNYWVQDLLTLCCVIQFIINSLYLFFQRAWPSFHGSACYFCLFGMLGFNHSHLSFISSEMITLVFSMWWHMSKPTFPPSNWHCKIPKLYYPKLFVLMSPFENIVIQLYLHSHVSLMDDLHEQEFVTLLINIPSDVMKTHF